MNTKNENAILADQVQISNYTLKFSKEDFENEWMHLSIKRKKNLILLNFIYVNIFNLFNEGFLMRNYFYMGDSRVVTARILLALFGSLCVYMIVFWKSQYFKEQISQNYQELEFTQPKSKLHFKRYDENDEKKLKQNLKIQRVFYMFLQIIFMINQTAFFFIITFDNGPAYVESQNLATKDQLRFLYLGLNLFSTLNGLLILNIRYLVSFLMFLIFSIIAVFCIKIEADEVANCYRFIIFACFLGWFPIFYIGEYDSKQGFLKQQKIKRLSKEQRYILENLPDGLIIHKGADVIYLNQTFQEMFKFKNQNNTQKSIKNLENIFLKNTCYQIQNQVVEQVDIPIQPPQSIIEQISKFESGQVYEIVYKDIFSGNFISNSNQLKFLIYIVSRQVLINDQLHTLTIIKDITFGVLYEQIKAQQNLRSIVNTTLKKKIGVPLQAVVNSCQNLLDGEHLQLFEQFQAKSKNLSKNIKAMTIQCKSVIFKLNDMSDWQAIQLGNFRKKNISYNLENVIKEIQNLMTIKAKAKKLNLNFHVNFDKESHIVKMISIQGLLKEIIFSTKCYGPLFHYYRDFFEKNHLLPKFVIGDPDRLQQVAINIIQNAIDYSYHGKIDIHISYDKSKQLLVFMVNDMGIGINPEDQKTIFKLLQDQDQKQMLLSDGKQMGLGLFISKQIVLNFQGDLDFVSEHQKGSTFIFSMELEQDEEEEQIVQQTQNMTVSPRFPEENEPGLVFNQNNISFS